MQIDITPMFNTSKIKATSKAAQRAVDKAIVSSLNKIAAQGTTKGKKAITTTYNIKARDITPAIKVIEAKKGHHVVTVHAKGGQYLSLYKFGGLPKQPVSQAGIKAPYKRRRKASAKVLKRGARTKMRHAFVAKLKGSTAIYQRTTGRSLPIRRLNAIGIPVMFKDQAVQAIGAYVVSDGQRIFDHELKHYLDKVKGG